MEERGKILLVDDNISLCKTMSFVLKRRGYNVTTANDGFEAIERVKEQTFDMIFMDIKMPELDGVETYKKIKKIRPEILVMMMTAYAVEDRIQEGLKEGAYGVIYKPLDIDKVEAIIEKAKQETLNNQILIVDDDEGTCTTLKNILIKRGYDVSIAHSGEDAIGLTKEKVYDIVFIDMKLPKMNGLETFFAIKEIHPKVTAIMMTGYRQEMNELVTEAIKNHALTCFYKPLDMKEFLKLVNVPSGVN